MLNRKGYKIKFVIVAGFAGSGKTMVGKALSKLLKYTYLDKDSITSRYTDYILTKMGSNSGDRESDLYVNEIRDIEYKTSFDLCMENLELGNSVILSIPFIEEIRDYGELEKLIDIQELNQYRVDIKVIWIKHNIHLEHVHVLERKATRDRYKLAHWEEYSKKINQIEFDSRYNIYEFINDSNFNSEISKMSKWIQKQ